MGAWAAEWLPDSPKSSTSSRCSASTTRTRSRSFAHSTIGSAGVVGLMMAHVIGFQTDRALIHAQKLGYAMQLTNFLRDIDEDYTLRGRVYLPQDELARFGYDPDRLRHGERDAAFRALMRFQVERARGYYDAAWPLVPLLKPAGRAVFLVLARTYRGLLDQIERRDYDVFSSRVRVSNWRKLLLALGALPARWGWR